MKKSKIDTYEILEDINLVLNNLNSLSAIEIDETNIDKVTSNIIKNVKNLEKKYKNFLPKEDLDSKK